MKTILPDHISTITEAKSFLDGLCANNESFHPEDDAREVIWVTCQPSENEKNRLNRLMRDISVIQNFDPCEYLLNKL